MISDAEKRVYKFVMNIASILAALPLVVLFLLIGLREVLPPHDGGEDVTERILSAPRQNLLLNMNQLFSANTICVVPPEANVNEYIRRALPEKEISVPGEDDDYEDNVARWRIVASWDSKPLVKVFDVWSTTTSKRKHSLELSAKDSDAPRAICSRRLLLKIESIKGEATATVQ